MVAYLIKMFVCRLRVVLGVTNCLHEIAHASGFAWVGGSDKITVVQNMAY